MDVKTVPLLLAQFDAWCQLNHKPNTCALYRSRLRPLGVVFAARELSSLTREELELWLANVNRFPDGRAKAPDTIRATAIAMMQFQKWAVEYQHLAALILPKIKKPMGRKRQRIPKPEETAKLLEHATPAFRRMYLALRQTGARPSELCIATIADWRRSEHAIVLEHHKTEKTGDPRRIAVGVRFEVALLEAIGDRTAGPIFLSSTGRAWKPQRLSSVYRKLRNAAGLPKDLCLYLARHEHGTQIMKKKDIFAAKEALGHRTIRTTERYMHATDEERAANQDIFE